MINPILSFIENMKLIKREKETRGLDEYQSYNLAIEAMKLDVKRDISEASSRQIASSIDDQHIVGNLDVRISGELGVDTDV